jgi:IclR family transcriptional regulator, KDG regulon repressor
MTMVRRDEQGDAAEARRSSVANAMLLLKSFAAGHDELGISALAKHLGLAKSTVHRLASTLADGGMLEHNEATGKYRLGWAVFKLGSLVHR